MIEKMEIIREPSGKNKIKTDKKETKEAPGDCPTEYCWRGCYGNYDWYVDTYYWHYDVANG
ncbi:MAG: hypothetical protein PHQ25_02845 [Acidobacteriota bacterium]|nr:hypothetical protein [Acidobacteriota bacterium]MDW3229354.1 hypothetical protein [Acidobacteriota bacterium]